MRSPVAGGMSHIQVLEDSDTRIRYLNCVAVELCYDLRKMVSQEFGLGSCGVFRTRTWDCWCRRSAGWRFSPFVGQAIPLMVEAWRRAPEEDDDLRELSLAALEGFVLRCPQASRCIPLLLSSFLDSLPAFSKTFHVTASHQADCPCAKISPRVPNLCGLQGPPGRPSGCSASQPVIRPKLCG